MADAVDRFWAKVNRHSGVYYVGDRTECWLWTAYTREGYGHFWDGSYLPSGNARIVQAYKWLWEQENGPVPDGLELDHLCCRPACVRPLHLEPVTHRVNLLRGDSPAARQAANDKCPVGHAYDSVDKDGARRCLTCRRTQCNASARRRREQASA